MKRKYKILLATLLIGTIGVTGCGKTTDNVISKDVKGVKLVKTYDEIVSSVANYVSNYDFTVGTYGTNGKVIDVNGNLIVDAAKNHYEHLGDEYYGILDRTNSKVSIYKNNKELLSFPKTDTQSLLTYYNNILYYNLSENSKKYVVAYDLEKGKELWRVEGSTPVFIEPIKRVAIRENGYLSKFSKIVDLNGNTILSAGDKEKIFYTLTKYSYKTINDETLEVYEDSNKVKELSLKNSSGNVIYKVFTQVQNGMIVLENTETKKYEVYDYTLKKVTELEKLESKFTGIFGKSSTLLTKTVNFGSLNSGYLNGSYNDTIVYNDGSSIEVKNGRTTSGFIYSYGVSKATNYVVDSIDNNGSTTTKVINISNKKTKELTSNLSGSIIDESPNSKYLIIQFEQKYMVLNENLDTLYEADYKNKGVKAINDNYIIEYTKNTEHEIYIINVNTKEKTKLEVEGVYSTSNSAGLVTKVNSKYNLYSFN